MWIVEKNLQKFLQIDAGNVSKESVITVGYQFNGLGKEVCDILRMAMIMMTGSLQQRFEQPKFLENSIGEKEFREIMALLEEKKINEAENLLLESLDEVYSSDDRGAIWAALYFYQTLNEMDEEELEQANYSREEIRDGIQYVMKIYQDRILINKK